MNTIEMKRISKISVILMSFVFLTASFFNVKLEARTMQVNGTFGTAEWVLYDDGVLEIGDSNTTTSFASTAGLNTSPWASYAADIKYIDFIGNVVADETSEYLFAGLSNLIEIRNMNRLDVSNVENMDFLFSECLNLISLDFAGWNTSRVNSMSNLFSYDTNLIEVKNFGDLDVSNVTVMNYMFFMCESIEELDLSQWDVSKVETMTAMFMSAPQLKKLDISGWDTASLGQMSSMFLTGFSEYHLSTIVLGPNSVFNRAGDTYLVHPDTSTGKYTGRWIGIDTETVYNDSVDFLESYYNSPVPDTYVWEANLDIVFETNGGSAITTQSVTTTQTSTEPIAPTKTDNVFKGWYSDEALTKAWNFNTRILEDKTLYAKWKPLSEYYNVTYDGNGNDGGVVPVDNNTYEEGDQVTVLSDVPTKTDDTFLGWSDGTTTYTSANQFVMPGHDVLLTAVWSSDIIVTHTVSYDGNGHDGGIVPTDNALYQENDTVTVLTGTPTKENYMFKGWSNGTTTYNANQTFIMPDNDVILTAVWEAIVIPTTYVVTYDGNGHDDGTVPTDNVLYQENDTVIVSSVTLTKVNHTFKGWSDGTTTYNANQTFSMPARNIILTAVWEPLVADTYTVIYDGNGHDGGIIPEDTKMYEKDATVTVLRGQPTKTGHTFKGWALVDVNGNKRNSLMEVNESVYQEGDTSNMHPNDIHLVAVWELNDTTTDNTDDEKNTLVETGEQNAMYILFGTFLIATGLGVLVYRKKLI